MSGIQIAAAVAALVLVVAKQFKAQKQDTGGRVWLLPAILIGISLLGGDGLLDPHHRGLSFGLEAAGVAASLLGGLAWGGSARVWRDRDGAVWSQGTAISFAVWAGILVVRVGLFGLGHVLDVSTPTNGLLLSLGAMLLARSGVLALRERSLGTLYAA